MKQFLMIVGVLAWLVVVIALVAAFGGGSDIQLIASGVYGTCGAVCLGLAAVLGQFQQLITASDSRTEE